VLKGDVKLELTVLQTLHKDSKRF